MIEAFCHEVIMKWSTTSKNLRYDKEFYEEVRNLSSRAALVTSTAKRLQVVRSAMRHLMMKSKELEEVLLSEYQLSKDWLGFTLVR
ncbi:hypothetical protein [Spirosoma endbachense]|uniref:Uncharacterized protein n=1 Tax=Spirosoma endbachense TaxID=2666025 RepID=A0A6P1W4G0_9BACT|nr:hypothetical protein [Spirosoma endbachense]QHW00314.1 hypothetical protein GJR95_37160 [Spirosoma endbachense]